MHRRLVEILLAALLLAATSAQADEERRRPGGRAERHTPVSGQARSREADDAPATDGHSAAIPKRKKKAASIGADQAAPATTAKAARAPADAEPERRRTHEDDADAP